MGSSGLDILVFKKGMLLRGDTEMVLLNGNLTLSYGHFRILMVVNQWAEKGTVILPKVTDSIGRILNFYCTRRIRRSVSTIRKIS